MVSPDKPDDRGLWVSVGIVLGALAIGIGVGLGNLIDWLSSCSP